MDDWTPKGAAEIRDMFETAAAEMRERAGRGESHYDWEPDMSGLAVWVTVPDCADETR